MQKKNFSPKLVNKVFRLFLITSKYILQNPDKNDTEITKGLQYNICQHFGFLTLCVTVEIYADRTKKDRLLYIYKNYNI